MNAAHMNAEMIVFRSAISIVSRETCRQMLFASHIFLNFSMNSMRSQNRQTYDVSFLRFLSDRKRFIQLPPAFAHANATSLQEGGFGTEAFQSCLGVWMMRLPAGWLHNITVKKQKGSFRAGEISCAGGAFLYVFWKKKNTRHPGRTIAQPPSCVFGRKEKKRKESEWEWAVFLIHMSFVDGSDYSMCLNNWK